MMDYQDEMKSVTVRVANGSGVIVQPLDKDCFYILTAHHVIKGKTAAQIALDFQPTSPLYGKNVNIKKIVENKDLDVAILIIERQGEEVITFYPCNNRHNNTLHWHAGYPNNQNVMGRASSCKLHDFNIWMGSYKKFFVEYKYQNHIKQEELDGMSGGGVFDNNYHLLGVHKQLSASEDQEQLGKNIMIPWGCFERLIAEEGIPSFDQTTFDAYKDDIFCYKDNAGAEVKLKMLLLNMAQYRAEVLGLSPKQCYSLFQKSRRVKNCPQGSDLKKEDWARFGEFMVALKAVWELDVVNHLDDAFPKFQYVQAPDDFDIYEVTQRLDPGLLGVVSNANVVFVVGGIKSKGYKQDVRQKDILDIAVGLEPNQEFDIAKTGREALVGFTFVNSHFFKDAMTENTDEIETCGSDKLSFYRKLIKSKI